MTYLKRFAEKIPKCHPLRQQCLHEWQLVFRDPSDQGEKHHTATPPPQVLNNSLDKFLQCWQDAEFQGRKVLSAAAMKETDNIRVHFNKGCLSGIQPGRGTNRNENLHKDLNTVMSNSKYDVELAYALFTIAFYNHNERMAGKYEQRFEYPIEHYNYV